MTTSPCHGKNGNTRLGAWTKQEDDKLIDYIKAHGTGNGCWSIIPKAAGLQRCGKSCRARWMNKLRSVMKRHEFCADEEELIIRLHALLGNRWSLIAGRLPGRSENEVKEYWNSHIKGKLVSLGIDPENHNLSQIPRCTENVNSIIWNGESSSNQYISKSLWGSKTSDMDDKKEVSSSDLNLDLTMAFHSFSPSPNCTAVKTKQPQQHVSDHELKVDTEADQDLEKYALILFR